METLTEFAEAAQSMVEKVGKSFTRSDDDWVPTLIVQKKDGEVGVVGFAGFPGGEEGKNKQVQAIRKVVRDLHVERLALVQSSWMVSYPADSFHRKSRPMDPALRCILIESKWWRSL